MIEKLLTISTAHISPNTACWLDEQASLTGRNKVQLIVYPKGEYGWFLPVYDEMIDPEKKFPRDLLFVLGYALGADCSWIIFDPDADDTLQKFDW
ncbi:hypothetical protein [Aneurinibacillus tyrosinisolvens]|uniref:DUF5983 family protein n=1 Tax=Aneurinibacillus tyrosinisolvens TaxID=1443435 RepID=UPI00063F63B7|nr:hypothetical protein [Aneurinibacillus tyrosinisolvens]